jgi:hypothetical protein
MDSLPVELGLLPLTAGLPLALPRLLLASLGSTGSIRRIERGPIRAGRGDPLTEPEILD